MLIAARMLAQLLACAAAAAVVHCGLHQLPSAFGPQRPAAIPATAKDS